MNTHTIYIELDGLEHEIEFEYSIYHQDAKLSSPWEDLYPEEESFDYNVLTTDKGLNAVESYELMELREDGGDVFYEVAMENIEELKDDLL